MPIPAVMRRFGQIGLALIAAAAVLAVTACGGSDSSGSTDDEQAYASAFAASLQSAMSDNNVTVSGEDAQCVGNRIVGIVGVEKLADSGLTPEEIRNDTADLQSSIGDPTPEQASQLSDAIFDCLNVAEIFVAGFEQSAQDAGFVLTDEKVQCLGKNFEQNEQMRELIAQSIITGKEPNFEGANANLLVDILGTCLSVEDLLKIGQAVNQNGG